MREILFKGAEKITNDVLIWHYGMLVKTIDEYTDEVLWFIETDDEQVHCVDPETVGQYTGSTDKNGRKIFEGDIVKSLRYINSSKDYDIGVVRFGNYKQFENFKKTKHKHQGFYIEWFKDNIAKTMRKHSLDCKNAEVIGNVYDNPELLEITE